MHLKCVTIQTVVFVMIPAKIIFIDYLWNLSADYFVLQLRDTVFSGLLRLVVYIHATHDKIK